MADTPLWRTNLYELTLVKTRLIFVPELSAAQIVLPLSPPGQHRGQRKNVCEKKGRGTRKKGEISDYIGRGKKKIK